MTISIFMHIYIGENAHWDIYAPPCKIITKFIFFKFFHFFFHFRCNRLAILIITNKSQKCFFISISILGRSGVKQRIMFMRILRLHTSMYLCLTITIDRARSTLLITVTRSAHACISLIMLVNCRISLLL